MVHRSHGLSQRNVNTHISSFWLHFVLDLFHIVGLLCNSLCSQARETKEAIATAHGVGGGGQRGRQQVRKKDQVPPPSHHNLKPYKSEHEQHTLLL
jgi:hypothetical protein